jgi:hypothetical protein
MTRWCALSLLLAALATARPAQAQDQADRQDQAEPRRPRRANDTPSDERSFVTEGPQLHTPATGRLQLTLGGMSEVGSASTAALSVPASDTLLWGDVRGVVEAEQLGDSRASFRGDFRLRLTPSQLGDATLRIQGEKLTTARGYLGGREYDLRELWIGYDLSDATRLLFGRQVILDADALTIDGMRLIRRFSAAWTLELFGGLYPNPFSRSLDDDYIAEDELAVAGGADLSYRTRDAWGAVAVAGASFFGANAGNGLAIQEGMPPTITNQVVGIDDEASRVFLYWQDYWRPRPFLDVYSYLVLDFVSEAGPELSNGHLALNLRASRNLRIEGSYSRMSTYAAEMYLRRLFFREPDANFVTIENNLLLMRMARDEARLLINVTLGDGRFVLYGIGRYRQRELLERLDPRFGNNRPDAVDLSFGARDTRSVGGLRVGLQYNAIYGYRSEVGILSGEIGRDFAEGLGSLDLQLASMTFRDDGFGATPAAGGMTACDPTAYTTCLGATDGSTLDAGIVLSYRASPHWVLVGDYHLVLNDSRLSGQKDSPTVYTNLGLIRLQYRF